MKAMVLAAGLGTRLRPYTDLLPKPMFPVLGVPVIEWALWRLKAAGVTQAVVNLHHLPAPIVRRLSSGARTGVVLSYSEEPILLGTGGGLSAVRSFFDGEDCFVLHNGDAFHEWDLGELVRGHRLSGAGATLALWDDPARPDARLVGLDGDRVTGIRGRPIEGSGPKYVFSGVSVLSAEVLEHLPPGEVSCLIENGVVPMIEAGGSVRGVVMDGPFHDVGTPKRYLDLQWDLIGRATDLFAGLGMECPPEVAPGLFHYGTPDSTVDLVEPVFACEGARIGPGATVGPKVVLSEGSIVQAGATVRDAVVFPGAVARDGATGIVTSLCAS